MIEGDGVSYVSKISTAITGSALDYDYYTAAAEWSKSREQRRNRVTRERGRYW
jgi:hypothetical protein